MSLKTPLIDVDTLSAMAPETVLIVDCRFDLADPRKGERDYQAGHIPGAVYASLHRDLADLGRQAEGLGRHPLPLITAFNAVLGRWGWRPGLPVVSYDAASGALAAARLWWLLRLAGVREAAVLDGGLAAWCEAGQPLETVTPARPRTTVDLAFEASQVVLDHASAQAPGRVLLDARAAPRYRGEVEPLDRAAGHVPGARNRPYSENLGSNGRFKSREQLRQEFDRVLAGTEPGAVVHMCGSGVTACHNLLAMEHAGLRGSRLYAPSWSGWISDPNRPISSSPV